MKLVLIKESFLKALQILQPVVSAQATSPILLNVLIEAEDDGIHVVATDMEIKIDIEVEGKVIEKGKTTIQAKRIAGIVRELPDQQLEIETDERHVCSINCSSTEYKIYGISAEDFPMMENIKSENVYLLEKEILREMLKKVVYAAASSFEESKKILNGVFFSFKEGKLTLVATDGRRLALVENDIEIPGNAEKDVVLPTKAVNELIHILEGKGNIKIQLTDNMASFQTEKTILVSKLIEGIYPNYRQVIPSECEHHVTLERETFLSAIRRVSLLTTERSNSIKLTFRKNQLKISAVTQDIGEARETMAIKYADKETALAFNPEYIIDPLRNLTSDEIFFEMTDNVSPGVIKSNIPFLYVIMPQRLD